jgi:L-fuconolactonase
MAVIDCHHHVWWLSKFPHQFPPAWGTGLSRDFTPDDLRPELQACGIDGTVLVQSLDNYDETFHYLDVADQNSFIRGVVGWVPLADPSANARALEALKPRKKFVGMRHLIAYEKDPRWVLQPTVQESLGQLAKARLAFEAIPVTEEQTEGVIEAARRRPDLAIVLNHLGRPPVSEKGWEPWASQMVRAAALPNISVKLSVGGDIVWRWPWSTEELRRYSDHVLQNFGPRRVMAGSNWPVILLSGSFQQAWRGIEDLVNGLSAADRAEVMGGAAERIYRLASS